MIVFSLINGNRRVDPSPQQIKAMTAQIRRSWTSQERRVRRAGGPGFIEVLQTPSQTRLKAYLDD